jgi:hypothetical protein
MNVQMRNRFPGIGAVINDDAKTAPANAELPRDIRRRYEHPAKKLRILFVRLGRFAG